MCNRISKIKGKLTSFYPNSGKKWPNWYQKLHNLHSFVKLGCPDPAPQAYIVNMDSMWLDPPVLEVKRHEKSFDFDVYGRYFFHLPADPKSMAKITGLP